MRSSSHPEIGKRQPSGSQDKGAPCEPGRGPGTLSIISLGPGDSGYLAPKARRALSRAEVIVGYKTYVDLVEGELLEGKEIISSGMKGEIQRCRMAIEKALGGRDTAVVSSGDAGIYGMAGLTLELLAEKDLLKRVEVQIIPGIPAFSAAAALLGAPLMHDFAVISLSDLMTPWEIIRQRVEAAAKADFVLVIYNPKSGKRHWQLEEAQRLILESRDANTPVGIVRKAAREGESIQMTTLSRLNQAPVDMLTLVVVGNSGTRILGGKMVTPRGYMEKYSSKK